MAYRILLLLIEYFPKKAKAAKKANATAAGQGRSAPTPAQEMPAEEKAALLHTLKEIQVHGQDHEFDPDTDCGGREPPKALKELRTHEVFAPADGGQEDERPKRHRPKRNWASVLNARNQSGPAKSLRCRIVPADPACRSRAIRRSHFPSSPSKEPAAVDQSKSL